MEHSTATPPLRSVLRGFERTFENKDYAMYGQFQQFVNEQLAGIREAGLYKNERVIASPQSAHIGLAGGKRVLNMLSLIHI